MTPYHLLPETPLSSYSDYLAWADSGELSLLEPGTTVPLSELEISGLRGRGGAGFPTFQKWKSLRGIPYPEKSVVLNAAEGEPGTYKDRWLIQENPYPILEGLVLGARAIGAKKIYLGIKASFSQEIARLTQALEDFRALAPVEDLEFFLVEGPDDYLFGEEKALLQVLEAGLPVPREAHYPPYERGVFGEATSPRPSLVQNVETFARAATIFRAGGAGFCELGTRSGQGLFLVTLSGALKEHGVFEIEGGTPLRTIFEEYGKGAPEGESWWGVSSGVANPLLPRDKFQTPLGYEDLRDAGGGLGSAGFTLFGSSQSKLSVLTSMLGFLSRESCTQCSACKVQLTEAHESLESIFGAPDSRGTGLENARIAARRAPQQNRCYLPVQGKVVTDGTLDQFSEAEFAPDPKLGGEVPILVGFNPKSKRFQTRSSSPALPV